MSATHEEIAVEEIREVLRPFAMYWETFGNTRLSDTEFGRLKEHLAGACEAASLLYRALETLPF